MGIADLLWGYFRDSPPNLVAGGIEFAIGAAICTSLFHHLIKIFSTWKIRHGSALSYCDSVALSCKLVSALFATLTCFVGVVGKSPIVILGE